MHQPRSFVLALLATATIIALARVMTMASEPADAMKVHDVVRIDSDSDFKAQDYNSSRSNREGVADTGGDGGGGAGEGDGGGEDGDKGKHRKSGNESSAIGTLR